MSCKSSTTTNFHFQFVCVCVQTRSCVWRGANDGSFALIFKKHPELICISFHYICITHILAYHSTFKFCAELKFTASATVEQKVQWGMCKGKLKSNEWHEFQPRTYGAWTKKPKTRKQRKKKKKEKGEADEKIKMNSTEYFLYDIFDCLFTVRINVVK